jgi:hypothetical protein
LKEKTCVLEELNVNVMELKKLERNRVENDSEKVKIKINKSNEMLNDLNLKEEETRNDINNSVSVEVIVVDKERNDEVSNGLISLNRDILMKRVGIIEDEKIRKDFVK